MWYPPAGVTSSPTQGLRQELSTTRPSSPKGEQVKVKTQELTPASWKEIRAGLRCRDGAFKAVGSQPVEAWHAVTGKIPILSTETPLGAGVERSAYIMWMRWYGNEFRVDLWWPLLKARVLQRTALVGAADSDFGNVAASETSDDDGDEAEAEED